MGTCTQAQYPAPACASSSATPPPLNSLQHIVQARTSDPGRVIGAKPPAFAQWVFELLGAIPADIYRGSGGIDRAWRIFSGEEGL